MKKTIKTLTVMIMVVMMITMTVIPALAASFDFDAAISTFKSSSGNTFTLKRGETHSPSASLWAQQGLAACYSNNESVVTVSSSGTVTAVGEGTAYVAIDTGRMYELYCYNVISNPTNVTGSVNNNSNNNNGFADIEKKHQENVNNMNEAFADKFDHVEKMGKGVKIGVVCVFIFIAAVFVVVFASIIRSRKLDSAIQKLAADPSQENAENAVNTFRKTSAIIRTNLSLGGDNRGTHFTLWRDVFNGTVIPSSRIKAETKEALKQELMRFSTYGLYNVVAVQSSEEAKEAAESFGKGGEDNVWHNLKSLQGCDVYRNVRINNGTTTSEIDAVVVDPTKGIFLLEIKSVGGQKADDGNKYISYNMLREEPGNQIYRHEFDFKTYFADVEIGQKIKNVLVFSWPNGDTRRLLAKNTFPQADYDIITVEQLMGYHRAQPIGVLSEHERKALASKLKVCSGDCIVR